MKIAVIALAFVAMAQPAQSFERMLRSDCRATVERLAEIVVRGDPSDQFIADSIVNALRVTPQGWCQLRARDSLEDAEFDTLEWRADGIKRWTRDGIPPLAIEILITGLEPDDLETGGTRSVPPLSVQVLLRQDPEAGLIIVERAVASNDVGDSLSVSGVFERVFLSSPSMMQVSMGSAAFKAGLMSMTLEGTHENPFGFQIDVDVRGNPQAQRDAAFDAITNLPDGLMSDATRAEFTAFAGDLPKPVGTLEVSVASERGLGLMQIGMSAYSSFASIVEDGEMSNQLDILFDGLSVDADWSPAAQVAD